MNSRKKPKKWILLLLFVGILAAGFFLLWNGSLFGKKLPEFNKEFIKTFTPLVPISNSLSTPGGIVEDQATAIPLGQTPENKVTPGENINSQKTLTPSGSALGSVGKPKVIRDNPNTKDIPSTKVPRSMAVCGQTKPMILLGLGIDENEQADVIRLARVDFVERRVLILSIPRDFWVPIPGFDSYNITQFKINAAYGYGEHFSGTGQGVVAFSDTIFQNYGIEFDRYAVFHFKNVEDLIDAVGGVDVTLDTPIGAYGTSGTTHFDGKGAVDYARLRDADDDTYRVRRQSEIIKAIFAKVLQPENIVKLPALGIRFMKDKTILSDFSLRDVYIFACLANVINQDSFVFQDIPAEYYSPGISGDGRSIRIPKPEATTYIQDLILNGNY